MTVRKPGRERRVYGVYGLTEWQALIPAGRATVRVSFTGGTMSAYGVVPAKFETDNPALQELIERSSYYTQGRIKRLAR